MSRPKKIQPTIISLEELIRNYDRDQLIGALNMLETNVSWKILQAALMKEYLNMVAYSLDESSKTGKQIEAAYHAGVAQCMYDTATSLISKYKDVLANKVGVIEGETRPEE